MPTVICLWLHRALGEVIALTIRRVARFDTTSNAGAIDEGAMSLLLILVILLVLLGGGGFYAGGPRAGIGLGGLILIVIVILALTGRL
jgi:hypothetical protein